MPQTGTIGYNFRLLPGDAPNATLDYLRTKITTADLQRGVKVGFSGRHEPTPPSPVTDSRGPHFALLKRIIQEHVQFGGQPVPVLPFLLPGKLRMAQRLVRYRWLYGISAVE